MPPQSSDRIRNGSTGPIDRGRRRRCRTYISVQAQTTTANRFCTGIVGPRPIEGNVMSIAARLRHARVRKGFSLQAAADKLGISKAHLWELEMGKSKNPSTELLNSCSDTYEVPVAWIIGEQAEEEEDDQLKIMFRQ